MNRKHTVENPIACNARAYRDERGHWGSHAEALCAEVDRLQQRVTDLQADAAHREAYWAQFTHTPKGDPSEPPGVDSALVQEFAQSYAIEGEGRSALDRFAAWVDVRSRR